uniref:Rubisco LSMT substrate-binding domain-containing protein n=1 Tax=Eutreptiella gymnastica TaxID=73025 RepID=A0A7S1NV89_9EUGL|mmetsp:Transcript_99712/g.171721  ORF Transcript_99712/g.171721 Transcript_99712/m.171721 type:complete len:589 (+) Transcript_99712:130-1896(+)
MQPLPGHQFSCHTSPHPSARSNPGPCLPPDPLACQLDPSPAANSSPPLDPDRDPDLDSHLSSEPHPGSRPYGADSTPQAEGSPSPDQALLDWLASHGAELQKCIFPVGFDMQGGQVRGVAAAQCIEAGDLVFQIPAGLLITLRVVYASPLREIMLRHSDIGGNGTLALALFLVHEAHAGANSFFHPYINALPTLADFGYIPHLWTGPEHDELQDASSIEQIRTEAARWRYKWTQLRTLFAERYPHVAALQTPAFSEDRFLWAVLNVQTRSFANGLESDFEQCLVPFADLLNHPPPGVTVDGPEWCPRQGSSGPCFQMRATAQRRHGEQLYNSYGAYKSCQALICQYGFVSPSPRAIILMDLAILPSKPKLQAMEERGWNGGRCECDEYLPYCRLAVCTKEDIEAVASGGRSLANAVESPLSVANELQALARMQNALEKLLEGCPTTLQEDEQLLAQLVPERAGGRMDGPKRARYCDPPKAGQPDGPTAGPQQRLHLALLYRMQWKRSLRHHLKFVAMALCATRTIAGWCPAHHGEADSDARSDLDPSDIVGYLESWPRDLLPISEADAAAAVCSALSAVRALAQAGKG